MAVISMWQCDRDGSMFTNKKDADAHDKMLELAECFTDFFESHVDGLSEAQTEALGLLLARNKDSVINACKGNTSVLVDVSKNDELDFAANVAPISKSGNKGK